jgi:nucleoid DNA-binding protein
VRGAAVRPLPPRAEVEVFNLIQSFIEILVQKDSVELRGCGNFLLVATDAILAVRAVPL